MTTPGPATKKPKAAKESLVSGATEGEAEEEQEDDDATKIARREALVVMLRDDLTTPYLTCQRCNSVTFINVSRVRRRDHNPSDPLSVYEQLPVCSGCGTTKYLRAGVVSFQEKITEEQQQIKEFEQKRGPATELLQRIAKGFLGRLEFRRKLRERELYLLRIKLAATRIQTRIRGMQARKRAIYERCLRIIRRMHPSILQFAVATRPDRVPVIWYDNPSELQVLYWNYREFVRRSGGKPPLFKVESNIMEIVRRMLLREYELVSRIQSRWRGLTTRLVFFEFKRQRGWLKSIQQSPAIKIQRLYRAHKAKHRCNALRAVKRYPNHMAAYRDERQAQQKKEMAKVFRKKLLSKYRLSYQVDKTCKMLALQTKPESHEDEDEEDDDAQNHAIHSLKDNTNQKQRQKPLGRGLEMENEKKDSPGKPRESQHPNARKLAEMKRLMGARRPVGKQQQQQEQRLRGPRLHILNAQEFTTQEEKVEARPS